MAIFSANEIRTFYAEIPALLSLLYNRETFFYEQQKLIFQMLVWSGWVWSGLVELDSVRSGLVPLGQVCAQNSQAISIISQDRS